MELSIIIPVLNESQSLKELDKAIHTALHQQCNDYEIIYVDDGSTDDSWKYIEELAKANHQVHGIQFYTNNGKSVALKAGIDRAKGDYIVTLDADLQDDPKEIIIMLNYLKKNKYDLVSGWKKKRYDPFSKVIGSRCFNLFVRILTHVKLHDINCGIKIYKSIVLKSLNIRPGSHRYLPVLAYWNGFKNIGEHIVNHKPRKYGKTKFGSSRFYRSMFDLITIMFFRRYLEQPIYLFGSFGLIFSLMGSVICIYLAYLKLMHAIDLINKPLLFLGILLVMVGGQFLSIGLLAELVIRRTPSSLNTIIKKNI